MRKEPNPCHYFYLGFVQGWGMGIVMKQNLVSAINARLAALGLPFQNGMGTDISLTVEFLDAGWSTGQKKITYEAAIFADEASNTVYMWEMTKETGRGFSFGEESDSFFQSGKTLFRKVKSIQYGPDGKAYEYNLNLGDIPKAIKESSISFGWKFKTVLNKKKALYPNGYTTAASAPINNPQTPQYDNNSRFCADCGTQLSPNARFCGKCGKGKPIDKFY